VKLKKRCEEIENDNTSYHDKLSNAQSEINTLKVKKSSEDRKIQKALNLYYDYERQKIGLDTKSLILENSQREAEQERREYEKRKNQFEGRLDEIKKQYNIILKLILIVFVPVVMASMILNIEKSTEIFGFMYMIISVPLKRMIGFIKAVADSGDAIDILFLACFIVLIIMIPICYVWYKLSRIKWHEKGKVISEKFDYKNLDETYFLPAIYFSEFVVIVYVDIFFFIPVNSFGLFLAVAVCTHFIYQAYIHGKIKTPAWKFK
jgi:cation transport ATPase